MFLIQSSRRGSAAGVIGVGSPLYQEYTTSQSQLSASFALLLLQDSINYTDLIDSDNGNEGEHSPL